MALPDELTAMTRAVMRKTIADNIADMTPTFDYFLKKFEHIPDGRPPEFPVRYAQVDVDYPQQFDPIGVGHYQLHTAIQPTAYAHIHAPTTVSKEERMQMSGNKWSVARIAAQKGEAVAQDLMMAANADLLVGVATSSFPATRRMCGFTNAIANAAYFNVAATDNWFDPQLDAATTLSDDFISAITAMKTTIKNYRGVVDVGITTGAIWDAIHKELQGREQVIVGEKGQDTYRTGAENLFVRGIRIWHDPDCTASELYLLTSSTWKLIGMSESGEFWDERPFEAPVDSHVWTAHTDAYPLLVCDDRRKNAKFSALA